MYNKCFSKLKCDFILFSHVVIFINELHFWTFLSLFLSGFSTLYFHSPDMLAFFQISRYFSHLSAHLLIKWCIQQVLRDFVTATVYSECDSAMMYIVSISLETWLSLLNVTLKKFCEVQRVKSSWGKKWLSVFVFVCDILF